ncbi:imidazole glycerol phosphate synthase subunit HisH, partial [Daejeonella sp.]
ILLPGVGSFDAGINRLTEKELFDPIVDVVINNKIPLLGICLGMQLLFGTSEEGTLRGLDLIEGEAKKFISPDTKQKIPHMAWNEVSLVKKNALMEGLDENRFYFVHSYYVNCFHEEDVLGRTQYINDFASMVQKDNIYGAQFHPEKSHKYGLRMFQNFLSI